MNGVTYETGALFAADRNDRRTWALHAGFLARSLPDRADPGACRSVVGRLASGFTGPLPRPVRLRAPHRRTGVATSNPTHIRKIADAVRARLNIEPV